jgi:predicted nucleic acid-binding protein
VDSLKYGLDASALYLYLTEQENTSRLYSIFSEIEKGDSLAYISTVNLAEFHRAVMRSTSTDNADKYVSWIKESRLSIVDLDQEIAIKASNFKHKLAKARSPFSWGDAFCLATAIHYECDGILTSDSEFDKVNDIEIIKI